MTLRRDAVQRVRDVLDRALALEQILDSATGGAIVGRRRARSPRVVVSGV